MYHILPLSISIVLLFTLIYLESCDDCSNPNICIMHECYHTELNLTHLFPSLMFFLEKCKNGHGIRKKQARLIAGEESVDV